MQASGDTLKKNEVGCWRFKWQLGEALMKEARDEGA